MERIIAYLKQCNDMTSSMAGLHQSMYSVYAKQGRPFLAGAIPEEHREVIEKVLAKCSAEPKQCWKNAATLSMDANLVFCEGYAILDDKMPLPIHHAWVVYKGFPIDVSWRTEIENVFERVSHNAAVSRYFGVEVPRAALVQMLLDWKMYDSVIMYQQRKQMEKLRHANSGTGRRSRKW